MYMYMHVHVSVSYMYQCTMYMYQCTMCMYMYVHVQHVKYNGVVLFMHMHMYFVPAASLWVRVHQQAATDVSGHESQQRPQ